MSSQPAPGTVLSESSSNASTRAARTSPQARWIWRSGLGPGHQLPPRSACVTRNSMIVSCWEPDRLPQVMFDRRASSGAPHCPAHQLRAGTTEVASEKGSGGRRNAATGSGRNGFRIRMRTVARTHLAHHLLTARTHAGVTQVHAHKGIWSPPAGGRTAPLSSELRHCTAYPEFRPEATWAQPLGREELS